jgi:hypothetical protein
MSAEPAFVVGRTRTWRSCTRCRGTGRLDFGTCPNCGGTGRDPESPKEKKPMKRRTMLALAALLVALACLPAAALSGGSW